MNLPRESTHELLAGYVIGDLTPSEQKHVKTLLRNRPELHQEIALIESAFASTLDTFISVDPPVRLRHRLLARFPMADHRGEKEKGPQGHSSGLRWHPLWHKWSQGLAAALILGLGWRTYQLQTHLAQTEVILAAFQSSTASVVTLAGLEDPTASGRLMFDTQRQQASLAFHNLPPAESNQIYRLWAQVGSQLVPCGEAIPAGETSKVMNFTINPEDFEELYDPELRGFLVTLENSPDIAIPTGSTILRSV